MPRLGSVAGLALAVAAVACSPASPPSAPTAPVDVGPDVAALSPASSPIALRRSAVADQYFWLRAKALEGEAPPEFRGAFDAMRDLREDLSADPTAWEDLEVPLGTVERAGDLVAAYGALEERRDVGGKVVALRAAAVRLARAMLATEAAYRRGPYRDHQDAIARAAAELSARLVPREKEILRAIEADMAVPGVGRTIVVTLVGDAPYPSAFAADDRGHVIASFVRVRGLEGTALVEAVLHEVLHAIDEITVRAPSALNSLRDALARRGLDPSDPNVEMAINTVTLAEAASLVRRFVDPAHRPTGELGFYTLYPPAPAIVAAWDRHVAGEPLEDTADAIVEAVAAP